MACTMAECRRCLEGLARRTAELAASNPLIREEAIKKGLTHLSQNFSLEQIPTRLAGEIQRIIRLTASNADPFIEIKKKEMKIARELAEELNPAPGNNLEDRVSFAARGNSIDFFLSLEGIRKEMSKPVAFTVNNILELHALLEAFKQSGKRKTILYFADNAGECYFDLPLINMLEVFADATYVVKESPVQNDLTLKDLKDSGIMESFKRVMTTGTDSPGLDLSIASKEMRQAVNKADLLLAKGMGNYETLPGLSLPAPIFYILKAKCPPVAISLKIPVNSYVALMG